MGEFVAKLGTWPAAAWITSSRADARTARARRTFPDTARLRSKAAGSPSQTTSRCSWSRRSVVEPRRPRRTRHCWGSCMALRSWPISRACSSPWEVCSMSSARRALGLAAAGLLDGLTLFAAALVEVEQGVGGELSSHCEHCTGSRRACIRRWPHLRSVERPSPQGVSWRMGETDATPRARGGQQGRAAEAPGPDRGTGAAC